MQTLTVLFDGDCPVCVRCRAFLEHEPQHVTLRFEDCRSRLVQDRYRDVPWLVRELVVISDEGEVWAGPAAFMMCFWALKRFRVLAQWMLDPLFLPCFEWLFENISKNRSVVGRLIGTCDHHCEANVVSPYR